MNDIIITTTDSIANTPIQEYLGIVNTNVVVGTGFFSDFLASFSDFFGGTSDSYQSQMDRLYGLAYEKLKQKATLLQADAVLGVHIDFDEISGKGKAMFMVSISGTAVKLKIGSQENDGSHQMISSHQFHLKKFILDVSRSIERGIGPNANEWDQILKDNVLELLPALFSYYMTPRDNEGLRYQDYNEVKAYLLQLMKRASYNLAVEIAYKHLKDNFSYCSYFIEQCHLFCPKSVWEFSQVSDSIPPVVELLKTDKDYYSTDDLPYMDKIIGLLDNLPDKGEITEVKSGLLSSKMVKKYICPAGHTNDAEATFCQNSSCGQNIKGLIYEQVKIIEDFKERTSILKTMLLK